MYKQQNPAIFLKRAGFFMIEKKQIVANYLHFIKKS